MSLLLLSVGLLCVGGAGGQLSSSQSLLASPGRLTSADGGAGTDGGSGPADGSSWQRRPSDPVDGTDRLVSWGGRTGMASVGDWEDWDTGIFATVREARLGTSLKCPERQFSLETAGDYFILIYLGEE